VSATAQAWWERLSARERRLILAALALLLAFAAISGFMAALRFRAEAADDLRAAEALRLNTTLLAARGAPGDVAGLPDPKQSVRAFALAAAQAAGLAAAAAEDTGAGRVSIKFAAASSGNLFNWMEQVARAGVRFNRASITRLGESDAVSAEFELAAPP
jgi:type II secretory pathway component PulM